MRLTAQADYAIVIMVAAACHAADGKRLNATLVADETGVPLPTTQKLVSKLASAGLIDSERGLRGGFQLSRPAAMISLADIIEAIEGPLALTSCMDETRHECAVETNCIMRPHWHAVNDAVRGALASITLNNLAKSAMRNSFPAAHVAAQPGSQGYVNQEC